MKTFAYFPGCTSETTGREYDLTTRQVFDALGYELKEIPDWNCCGASSAHSVSEYLSLALPGGDLAKAERMGADVLVPCAACFNRLAHANKALGEMAHPEEQGLPKLSGKVRVLHPMRPLSDPEVLEVLRTKVRHSLKGLPVVAYYGCLTVRPAEVTGTVGPEVENPTAMDVILTELGAEVKDWSYKTVCCGAGAALPYPDVCQRLSLKIIEGAAAVGAQAVVTACPLCFTNLETQQKMAMRSGAGKMSMPVFYFTELMALCMGLPKVRKTLRRHLIPVGETLSARSVQWR